MKKPATTTRTAKIELRVRPHEKALLVKAAAIRGGGLSRFVLDAAFIAAGIDVDRNR